VPIKLLSVGKQIHVVAAVSDGAFPDN